MPVLRDVLSTPEDDDITIIYDTETSEDEKRKARGASLRKKAITASKKIRHSFKKRRKQVADRELCFISIKGVRDAKGKDAINALSPALLANDAAYQEETSRYLRVRGLTAPEVAAARVEHLNSRSDVFNSKTPKKLLQKFMPYVTSLLLQLLLKILACIYLAFSWLERTFTAKYAEKKLKNNSQPQLVESQSQWERSSAEIEDDLLCKKLQHLESLVKNLCNKPSEIPLEQEDMLLEFMNQIIVLEYELQKTKKALLTTASKQVELNESMENFMETCVTDSLLGSNS